jgi:hypothetical protein
MKSMGLIATAFVVAGCHGFGPFTGDDCVDADDAYDPACDPDPDPDPDPDFTAVIDGALAPETTLFTSVVTFVTSGDATVIAMRRVAGTDEVRLVSRDVRFDEVLELDRMPIGEGVPQILVGREAVVWGFGGTLPDGGTFRAIEDGVARDLDFGTRSPSVLLNQHTGALTYASIKDCRVERLDLATAAVEEWGTFSCFADFTTVALDEFLNIWLRVDEASGTSIGMMDGLWPGAVSLAKGNMEGAVGPFVGIGAYWFVENTSGNEASFYQGASGQWPVPLSDRVATLPTAFDAATLVEEKPWGASRGTPAYLFRVGVPTTTRYPISYHPVKMLGLHGRLIIQLENETLLEQLTDEL